MALLAGFDVLLVRAAARSGFVTTLAATCILVALLAGFDVLLVRAAARSGFVTTLAATCILVALFAGFDVLLVRAAHTDEIYFRDTAHGLLVWALGAVISLSLLTSAASSLVSGVAHAGAAVAQSAGNAIGGAAGQVVSEANSSGMGDPSAYFTDMLFRTDHPAPSGDAATSHTEVAHSRNRRGVGRYARCRQDLCRPGRGR